MAKRELIDATPTWSALLPVMLHAYRDSKVVNDAIRIEFEAMARAADQWNEHMRQVHARNKRYGD